MKAHLVKILYAEAAHRNRRGTAAQQRMHGHSYQIEVLGAGAPDAEVGWVVDFSELKQVAAAACARLDHACLNKLPGLEEDTRLPALQAWLMEQLRPHPAWFAGVRVSIVGDLVYRPVVLPADKFEELPERVRFTFEAAQYLPQLPGAHPCKALHGHSYRLEAGAENTESLLRKTGALYELLDHRCLNDVGGLDTPTCENICAWVWRWMKDAGEAPTAVVVQETASARSIYYGED